jgi:FKBP-type peptidyl-prolyl cis-trans isomerase SlyD
MGPLFALYFHGRNATFIIERTRDERMSAENGLMWDSSSAAVAPDKVVRLRFQVSDAGSGELLQYGDDLFYLHGGYGGAFPKVEQVMQGRRVGDSASVCLAPEEGYGDRDPALIIEVPLAHFEEDLPRPGESVRVNRDDGVPMLFTVSEVSATRVTLDGNHPFAGRNLAFVFEVLAVRDSLAAERRAGFAFDHALAEPSFA